MNNFFWINRFHVSLKFTQELLSVQLKNMIFL